LNRPSGRAAGSGRQRTSITSDRQSRRGCAVALCLAGGRWRRWRRRPSRTARRADQLDKHGLQKDQAAVPVVVGEARRLVAQRHLRGAPASAASNSASRPRSGVVMRSVDAAHASMETLRPAGHRPRASHTLLAAAASASSCTVSSLGNGSPSCASATALAAPSRVSPQSRACARATWPSARVRGGWQDAGVQRAGNPSSLRGVAPAPAPPPRRHDLASTVTVAIEADRASWEGCRAALRSVPVAPGLVTSGRRGSIGLEPADAASPTCSDADSPPSGSAPVTLPRSPTR